MTALPDPVLAEVSAVLRERLGLDFPRRRWPDLERSIAGAARDVGSIDPTRYAMELLSGDLPRSRIEHLAGHLTVGETYFFREKESFDSLEQTVLPELIRSRREHGKWLRIWCAGCCTGEEPYSIGIFLARMIPDLQDWNISILATDLNPAFLREAAQGIYRDWSLRATPQVIRDSFFTKTGDGRYAVASRIKSMVSFDYLNLAEDTYPSMGNGTNGMDIIFCRNVLIYFQPDHSRKVIRKLAHSLAEQGVLYLSSAELSLVAAPELETVTASGAIFFRKNATGQRPIAKAMASARKPTSPIGRSGHRTAPSATPTSAALERRTMRPKEVPATPITQSSSHQETIALYEQGRYAEAAERLRELLSEEPRNADLLALLAQACANQGHLPEALEWCDKAIGIDKSKADWSYLRATILQEQGLPDDAAAALRRALYLDQNHALAHFALGNLARHRGQDDDSIRHFRNALAVLNFYQRDQVLPGSDGMTAGRLAEIIQTTVESGV